MAGEWTEAAAGVFVETGLDQPLLEADAAQAADPYAKKRPCALCARSFTPQNLPMAVSLRRVYDVRESWGKKLVGRKVQSAAVIYDRVFLCVFCAHICETSMSRSRASRSPGRGRSRSPGRGRGRSRSPGRGRGRSRSPGRGRSPTRSPSPQRDPIGAMIQESLVCKFIAGQKDPPQDDQEQEQEQEQEQDQEQLHNLAVDCATRQSSTASDCRAYLAVTGRATSKGELLSTQTQAEQEPFWEVDLGRVARVDAVRVWLPTDEEPRPPLRLMASIVAFGASTPARARQLAVALRLETEPRAVTTWSLDVGSYARYVRVQRADAGALRLSEVEVLTTDPDDALKGIKRAPIHVAAGSAFEASPERRPQTATRRRPQNQAKARARRWPQSAPFTPYVSEAERIQIDPAAVASLFNRTLSRANECAQLEADAAEEEAHLTPEELVDARMLFEAVSEPADQTAPVTVFFRAMRTGKAAYPALAALLANGRDFIIERGLLKEAAASSVPRAAARLSSLTYLDAVRVVRLMRAPCQRCACRTFQPEEGDEKATWCACQHFLDHHAMEVDLGPLLRPMADDVARALPRERPSMDVLATPKRMAGIRRQLSATGSPVRRAPRLASPGFALPAKQRPVSAAARRAARRVGQPRSAARRRRRPQSSMPRLGSVGSLGFSPGLDSFEDSVGSVGWPGSPGFSPTPIRPVSASAGLSALRWPVPVARPTSAAPARPVSAAPARPVSAAPARPITSAVPAVRPTSAAPAAPAAPKTSTPEAPKTPNAPFTPRNFSWSPPETPQAQETEEQENTAHEILAPLLPLKLRAIPDADDQDQDQDQDEDDDEPTFVTSRPLIANRPTPLRLAGGMPRPVARPAPRRTASPLGGSKHKLMPAKGPSLSPRSPRRVVESRVQLLRSKRVSQAILALNLSPTAMREHHRRRNRHHGAGRPRSASPEQRVIMARRADVLGAISPQRRAAQGGYRSPRRLEAAEYVSLISPEGRLRHRSAHSVALAKRRRLAPQLDAAGIRAKLEAVHEELRTEFGDAVEPMRPGAPDESDDEEPQQDETDDHYKRVRFSERRMRSATSAHGLRGSSVEHLPPDVGGLSASDLDLAQLTPELEMHAHHSATPNRRRGATSFDRRTRTQLRALETKAPLPLLRDENAVTGRLARCSLCQLQFPRASLFCEVTWSALQRVQRAWVKRNPSMRDAVAIPNVSLSQQYDNKLVCAFCHQFFSPEASEENPKAAALPEHVPQDPAKRRSSLFIDLRFPASSSESVLERRRRENAPRKRRNPYAHVKSRLLAPTATTRLHEIFSVSHHPRRGNQLSRLLSTGAPPEADSATVTPIRRRPSTGRPQSSPAKRRVPSRLSRPASAAPAVPPARAAVVPLVFTSVQHELTAMRLQAWWRRASRARRERCVLTMQRVWRGHRARSATRAMLSAELASMKARMALLKQAKQALERRKAVLKTHRRER